MSICFLYLRIFPGEQFHRVVKITQVFNVLILIGFVLTDLDQCQPISYFWTGWDKQHTGWCFNSNAMIWAEAAVNIVMDFWLLALPASQLYILNPGSSRKRLGVHLMFALGILYAKDSAPMWLPCTSLSFLPRVLVNVADSENLLAQRLSASFDCKVLSISPRPKTLQVRPNSHTSSWGFGTLCTINVDSVTNDCSPTVDFFGVGIWSASESTIGIMIASLPAAYQMFKRRRQHEPGPQSSTATNTAAGGFGGGSCAGCCQDHHSKNHMPTTNHSTPRGLRRRHSISIDTTTAGKCSDDSIISPRSFLAPSVDDSDAIELTSPLKSKTLLGHPECACGRAWPKPGEYLGVSERYMANQDVSVTITNASGEGTRTLSPEKARYYI